MAADMTVTGGLLGGSGLNTLVPAHATQSQRGSVIGNPLFSTRTTRDQRTTFDRTLESPDTERVDSVARDVGNVAQDAARQTDQQADTAAVSVARATGEDAAISNAVNLTGDGRNVSMLAHALSVVRPCYASALCSRNSSSA